jgi:serine/threonine protein kinase
LEKEINSDQGRVFKAINIKTGEVKTLRLIEKENNSDKILKKIKIGKEIGNTCEYLICYDQLFEGGDGQCIVMDYFENGNLQDYLNKGYELNENVFFFFVFCFIYFMIGYKPSNISDICCTLYTA